MSRTITLCLIVKDEEELLAGCLDSARGLADEIVVVDTGSTDRTVSIAESYGARVLHRPWTGDFSAARNASLDAATGEFVLVLDADERLTPAGATRARVLVEAEAADAPPTLYLPLISNVDREGRPLGADHMPRLWRHRPALRFTGRIHERVGEGVRPLRRVYDDLFEIIHVGYDPDLAALRDKRARNVRLLEAELRERPGDPALCFYLAKEQYAAGDDQGALAGFLRVIEDGSIVNFALSATVFAVECLRSLGHPQQAMELALDTLRRHPDYGELWFVAGQAAMAADRPIQAIAQFERARLVPQGVAATAFRDPSIPAWRADRERARAMLAAGDVPEGVALIDALRARLPDDEIVPAELDVVDAWINAGQEQLAWRRLEPLLEEAPAESVPALLRFINLYVNTLGPEEAHTFLERCLHQFPTMLHQLEIVAAAAELAEMIGHQERLLEWLTICTHLNTPVAQHYVLLARLLKDRGDVPGAQRALRAAQRLLSSVGEA